MIDSLTILSKGGLILFQHNPPSGMAPSEVETEATINTFISNVLLDPTKASMTRYINEGTVVEWKAMTDLLIIVLYSEEILRNSKSVAWLARFMDSVGKEYSLFEVATSLEDEIIPDTTLLKKSVEILWTKALKHKDFDSPGIESRRETQTISV